MDPRVVVSGLHGQDESAAETLRILLDAVSELSSAVRLEEVQEIVGEAAKRLLRADGAGFMSPDAPLAQALMAGHEPVTVEDVHADGRLPADLERPASVKSLLVVPVRRGDPLAAVGIHWETQHTPTGEEIHLAQALADCSAVAIEYVRLRAELAESMQISGRDDLTGIANRRAWDQALRAALDVGQSVTMILIDLDRFKQFNDAHGHRVGDELLSSCASSWNAALRETDLIARYGGEEFAVLLPDVSLDRACQVAERLQRATPPPVTASLGVARSLPFESVAALTARADAALYRAKRDGRNRVSVSD